MTRLKVSNDPKIQEQLLQDITWLVDSCKSEVAKYLNSSLVILYWKIGARINQETLKNQRAEYGKKIIAGIADQLLLDYGKGFSKRNLFNMLRFAQSFPEFKIVQTLSAQLSWSHIIAIIYIDETTQGNFSC